MLDGFLKLKVKFKVRKFVDNLYVDLYFGVIYNIYKMDIYF